MRPLGLGLAAALVIAVLGGATVAAAAETGSFDVKNKLSPEQMRGLDAVEKEKMAAPIDAAQRAAGMKAAPGLIAAGHMDCDLVDARLVGSGTGSDKIKATYYEIACKNGMGRIVVAKDKVPEPTSFDCLMMGLPGPDGKPNPLTCTLPGNRNPAPGLRPLMVKAGQDCAVSAARYVGSTADKDLYEVACPGSPGFILDSPKAAGSTPTAVNCVIYAASGGPIKCTLTPQAVQDAYVEHLASAGAPGCTVKDRRFVGATADRSDFFEVSCADGKGYMLQTDASGKFVKGITCASAMNIGNGCSLTDTRQALTQQTSVYTDLAKKAGFDCAVSKYADFPTSSTDKEVVELACSNRPDGGVGVFPTTKGSRNVVYDCIRSQAEGYKCSYSPESAVYPILTAQLRAKGKTSCVVSGARALARTTEGGHLIEVACADGGPGWVLDYVSATDSTPAELLNCAQVGKSGGGCQLPSNKKS
jgi:hypothetical protein